MNVTNAFHSAGKAGLPIIAIRVLCGIVCLLPFGLAIRLMRAEEAPSTVQSPPLPDVPPLADGDTKDEPGLMLTIAPLNAATPATFVDKRISRMLAFEASAGSVPSVFTTDKAYKLTFEGDLTMRLRDFLIFSAMGHGKLAVTINGKPVLDLTGDFADKPGDSTRLTKGKNHIIAEYESEAGHNAELRLFWATKTTLPEPVPPAVFSHTNGDKALRESLRLREGRTFVGQLRCTKCHAVSDITEAGLKTAMPELTMDAPALADIGGRLNADWMAAWINNPRTFRPNAHMPRLFTAKNGIAPEARDIAAYLATLGTHAAGTPDSSKAKEGGRTFANLDCVACHISPERKGGSQEVADAGRISLAYVKAKFKPTALKQFLLNPSAHYAWISMPNFRLSNDEADGLAAYLLSSEGRAVDPSPSGDAANGEKLIGSSGCLNCHTLATRSVNAPHSRVSIAFNAITKDGWFRGCMAADGAHDGKVPYFVLTEGERAAILAFAATDRSSLKRECAPEFAERRIAALRCTACHNRDGHESMLVTDLDAENQELRTKYPTPQQGNGEGISPDQRAPMITWAGEKLRPEWLQKFVAGEIPYKPRYYLRARMPGFSVRPDLLAQGLAAEHGCAPTYPAYGPADKKLADIGQNLVGKTPNMSFSCVQCHSINQQAALAPFEAPSINFMYVTSRLRQDYYYRWIHDPLRVDPETKMPRFDDNDGKTGVPIFDNDASKQFEAIWNYLLLGKDIAPPAQ